MESSQIMNTEANKLISTDKGKATGIDIKPNIKKGDQGFIKAVKHAIMRVRRNSGA